MKISSLVRWMAGLLAPAHNSERSYFDDAYYRAANPDVAEAGVEAFDHYMRHGWKEGRNPSPTFSTLYYRDRHLDGADANPLTHYAQGGGSRSNIETRASSPDAFIALQHGLVSNFFDPAFYAAQNGPSDDPVQHYLGDGWRKGYSPSPAFDPNRYIAEHPFVRALGVSPFYHHQSQRRLLEGAASPRKKPMGHVSAEEIRAVIAAEFDPGFYLAQYADVRNGKREALDHFVEHGWRELRNPTPLFDSRYYRAKNRDVASSDVNLFHHYIRIGRAEGRRPNPVGTRLYPKLGAPSSTDWLACRPAADLSAAEYIVIMPVYRGFGETLAAIHAVLTARQKVSFALHVINDKTPDLKLETELARLAAAGLISLDVNLINLGFVKTCNRGLRAFPDKSVVLLNADAVVFGNWLDRIDAHVRTDPLIATLTPLSNNATICSYPVVNGNNLVETECSAEMLDRLTSQCNAGRSSDVPTGVGFCFFMSRDSRAAIGLFDETAFGRGYGEENDFCLRAAKAGLRNVLAEDIFVYHAGQVSFAGLAATEGAPGQAALIAKHPDYPGRVKQHLQADPGSFGRMRLDLKRLARFAGRRSIVFVSHALEGGIVTHIKHMEQRLRSEGVEVVHLRVGVLDRWSVQVSSDANEAPFCPNLRPTSLQQIRPLLAEFLSWLSPMAIHIHSLAGFDWEATTGLLDLVRVCGVPYYFTLHDYSVVCHRNDLVLTNGRYCGLPNVETCRVCAGGDRSYPEAIDPATRRRTFAGFLDEAAAVFAPSYDIKSRLQAAGATYPISVRPHEDPSRPSVGRMPLTRSGLINVVTLGGIGIHKGAQIILDLARDAAARGLPIRYHVIGYSDRSEDMKGAGVNETGRYSSEEEAAAMFETIRPACIFLPSIWPETFCYTLSLAFSLGVPPVVFDLGAQRERVEAAGFGFVLPYGLIDDVMSLNDRLITLPYAETTLATPTKTILYPNLLADYYGLPLVDEDRQRPVDASPFAASSADSL